MLVSEARSSLLEVFCKKVVLRNFAKLTGKHLCPSFFLNKVAGLIKKETLAQVFSCEFCEISKNNFSYRTPPGDCFLPLTPTSFLQDESRRLKNSICGSWLNTYITLKVVPTVLTILTRKKTGIIQYKDL